MTKAAFLYPTLLLAGCMAFAQAANPAMPGYREQTNTPGWTATSETVQGCLSREGSTFYLTETGDQPKQYQILGDASVLAGHVGQTVSITGSLEPIAASSPNAAPSADSSDAGIQQNTTGDTIRAHNLQMISSTCNTGGYSSSVTTPTGMAAARAEQTPALLSRVVAGSEGAGSLADNEDCSATALLVS